MLPRCPEEAILPMCNSSPVYANLPIALERGGGLYGWDSHDTEGCPDPIEKQPCLNWTKKGHCARGRKCKYMHDNLPPVPGPSQAQANAEATVAASTQCSFHRLSRADQISQSRKTIRAKMVDTQEGADYEPEDSNSSH